MTLPSTCGSASSGRASASTRRRSPRSRPRRRLPTPDDVAAIEIALGGVHRRRGDMVAAAELSRRRARDARSCPTRSGHAASSSEAWSRSGPATSGMPDEAASAARDLATRVGDPHLAGVAERIVGLVAQSRGDSAAARAALERSVAMAADDPDVTASIAAMTALALTIAGEGEVDEAMVLGVRAVEACRRIGDRHLEAAVENHLADLLHEAGRDDLAMDHLKRAVTLFADIGEGAGDPDPGIWTLAAW